MNEIFSQEQLIFLKTVYTFCEFEYHYYVKDDTTLSEFIDEVVDQALEDKEYSLALYQKFHTEDQIIYILSYVCAKIWFKN